MKPFISLANFMNACLKFYVLALKGRFIDSMYSNLRNTVIDLYLSLSNYIVKSYRSN